MRLMRNQAEETLKKGVVMKELKKGKPQGFLFVSLDMDQDCLKNIVTTSSTTFTVESTGLVGTSAVTITAVLDYSKSYRGSMLYWRVD